MQYVELGRTGLRVSRLCLGTMNFGVHTSEEESFAIMDRALELGINFFDTADRYGKPQGLGLTEQLIGRWLAQGGRRERFILATKVYGPMGPGANNRGLSAYHIRRACEASLRRLQTDHIDLYQMHHVDLGAIAPHHVDLVGRNVDFVDRPHLTPGAPWEEIWQAMEGLVQAGKITYVGSSNFAGWNIAQACETAKSRRFLGLVSEQSVYSLAKRHIELEVIPACRAYGLAHSAPLRHGTRQTLSISLSYITSHGLSPAQLPIAKRSSLREPRHRDHGRESPSLAWLPVRSRRD